MRSLCVARDLPVKLPVKSSDTCERFVWFFSTQQGIEMGGLSVSATKTKIKCSVLKEKLRYYIKEQLEFVPSSIVCESTVNVGSSTFHSIRNAKAAGLKQKER